MIIPATLVLQDGVPYSPDYADIYHTRSGGLEQAQQVFMAGNDLPKRWQGHESFAILETGFGLGLNFLTTWAAWQKDPNRSERLHFVSVEKHPFSADDLAQAHTAWPELQDLSVELRTAWPPLLPGYHRLHLNQGKVILTLIFGDAVEELRRIEGRFNAFYLDGFSPANNPELWTPEIAWALARVAAPDATLATWSVAGSVRNGLDQAGFNVEKRPGFGSKRQMLVGTFRHRRPIRYTPPKVKTALVIGAGIAGSSIAERLASRGWQVTVLEAESAAGQGASGNIAGVLRPLPSADDNRLAKLTRAGFLAIRQQVARLEAAGLAVRWSPCGVLQLAQSAEQAESQRRAVEHLQPPADFLQFLDAQAASQRLGTLVEFGAWFFPTGGWVQPPSICAANLAAHPDLISTKFGQAVHDVTQTPEGHWQALDAAGNVLAEASIAVIASGVTAPQFTPLRWLPQTAVRGQVSHVPADQLHHPLPHLVCGHGYIAPAVDGVHVVGASTVLDDPGNELRDSEHTENLNRLRELLPDYLLENTSLAEPSGRVGFRPTSPDRLPIVGAVPSNHGNSDTTRPKNIPGLWCLQGFGARGIVWSALMAELLVSQIMAEPLPLSGYLVRALAPSRQFPIFDKEDGGDNMSQV
ncbi:MAG: bifunctional tRNA (5-methylaminomethyl-2-thiouridine)(34)-methyltransferase MnmD/FAD-dependent [Pseudomonadota bacterium]|jgi:tRNA 5-methylaminomethyl-2-thiouridine biosynthesis bifunctional protein